MIDPSGNIYYYLKDHLGSTRVTLRDNGVAYGRYYECKAYGDMVREEVKWNQHYKFTGKPFDIERGINLYYFGTRYYDPFYGRWLAPDPAAGKYPGWSPYAYAKDNPIKFVDPTGDTLVPITVLGRSGENPLLKDRTFFVDSKIATKVVGLFNAAEKAGFSISMNNAFRTTGQQSILYGKMEKGQAAKPGTSKHEAAFAFDLNNISSMNTMTRSEFYKIASAFGFKPLPGGKEPWHLEADPKKYEYPSVEAAINENQEQFQNILKMVVEVTRAF